MIRLKEELKSISNNKLSKIKMIAKEVRNEFENYYDWKNDKKCFGNTCHTIARDLEKKLKEAGIYAYRVNGLYYGADEDFEPDMSDWTNEERWEYNDAIENGDNFGFNHWWVVADNKFIVDISADQFFPDEEDEYRVIITDLKDSNYGS